MELIEKKDWPILFIDKNMGLKTAQGQKVASVISILKDRLNCSVLISLTCKDGHEIIRSRADLGCVVLGWDFEPGTSPTAEDIVKLIRERNTDISILIMTNKVSIADISVDILDNTDGYIWIEEDTDDFIAGRIEREVEKYIEVVLPPFFKELVRYAEEYKYAWHTPGHMGGFAFLRSPAGIACHKFFGENLFRADLSISVPELGSLLDHEGVVGDAEKESARVFGADYTLYVLNGTSTANQVVWHARVTRDDIALMDRNCHKSLNYAMIITGAVPIYMIPTRNPYGTIGPIHVKEFSRKSIQKKIKDCPLIKDKTKKIKMAVVTNSTYDGLCYNVTTIKQKLGEQVGNLHFDEAWFGYARFHPLYDRHFGMCADDSTNHHPPIFATQSTHKLLAALSQASMIHIKNGSREKISCDQFNEAYMMHGSTSPQYSMIATLDVSTRMMKGVGGRQLMNETLEEAIVFRKKMAQITKHYREPGQRHQRPGNWWFTAWQPYEVEKDGKPVPFEKIETEYLVNHQECWTLKPGQSWHQFPDIEPQYIMLDPQKVTIATPGISLAGEIQDWGIPAAIVTQYLINQDVVVEKTGHYSWLCLFSLGTSRGKSGTLLAEMFNFKGLYDLDAPLEEALPGLVHEYPQKYAGLGLREFCDRMHTYIKDNKVVEAMLDAFAEDALPKQDLTPANAYDLLVQGNIKYRYLEEMEGQVAAVMVVPYPPGIPVIMPGEIFNTKILEYLKKVEDFEYQFPGFESDIHGVKRTDDPQGKKLFQIYCLTR